MRISDWSSDVCSSDLAWPVRESRAGGGGPTSQTTTVLPPVSRWNPHSLPCLSGRASTPVAVIARSIRPVSQGPPPCHDDNAPSPSVTPLSAGTSRSIAGRSEEHTSELQSLMRISYDVFCLEKKTHIMSPLM